MAGCLERILEEHDRCRNRVCVVCYKKGQWKISDRELKFICSNLIEGYDTDNLNFPCSLCENCHILISKKLSSKEVNFPQIESYDPERAPILRNSERCKCRICTVAKSSAHKRKCGRPKEIVPNEQNTPNFKICGNCFAKIAPGYSHQCTSRRAKVDNVQNLLINTPTTSQRVASRIIDSTETSVLATLGPNPKQIGSSSTMKKQLFTTEDMGLIQTNLNLSNRQVMTLADDLRATSGSRKLIESGMKEKLRAKNRQLHDLFENKLCTFATENKKEKTRVNFQQHVVICNDLNGLIEKIIEERSIDEENMLIRIGLDGGGGFMKVCLSVFELDQPKGKISGQRFKDSGVKKVMIIGIVPDIQENYVNIKRLWMEIGIDNLNRKFTIATDLKLCNILVGMMSHSSTHPCCWCDVKKGNLRGEGESRTVENLMNLFWNFFDSRADVDDAKEYGNVIHANMFASGNIDESTKIILLIPPPELHLLIGPVNHLFEQLLKVWKDAEEWIARLHIKREEYHGGSFNGNDSRKLLKNITILEELAPSRFSGFVNAFKAFNDVVTSCYGEHLSADYKDKIKLFKENYIKLGINVTPKIHAVFYHITEFCEVVNRGLSPWSEQTAESLHSDFRKIWAHYKVRDTEHKEFGKRLMDAVITYNSRHL